jgi:putative addiction module component (TIGR02574 family)
MGKLKDKSLHDILNRSVAEKILAVEKLWDNIKDSFEQDEPTVHEKKMIKQRLTLYKENPAKVKKWEDVKADYLKKK